tara:strand:- start:3198 stop:6710 length:3513 start_codon:yes stop_codon:yes gene_type:complete
MATKIQVRRDTAANWTSANTVLSAGEMGWESDTGFMKIGDGTTAWSSLSYFTPSGADANTTYTVGVAQNAANADITLSGSDASTDTFSLVAGSNLTLAVAGDDITVNALDSQYSLSTETGGIIRLTASGNATGTDDITIAGGTGISVADGSDTLTVNLDAAFNDLSDTNSPTPSTGDHLQWDGSNWVNEPVYFNSTKRFMGGLGTDRFIELQNRVITVGSISSGDVINFPTNFSGGSNYGIEWQINNPQTDFIANLTPGPVNINTSTYFRIIIDNSSNFYSDKGYISGLQRNGVAQTVNWTNTIDGTAPNVSGADVYDIYEFYCFRGNGGSDETWYGTLLTGASGTLASLNDVDVLANSGNPTPVDGSFLEYDSGTSKWEATTQHRKDIFFKQGIRTEKGGVRKTIYWDETIYTGTDGDTLTLSLDNSNQTSGTPTGNSGAWFIESIDYNFVADLEDAIYPDGLYQGNSETLNGANTFTLVVDNNVRNETRIDTIYPPSGIDIGETIIINGQTLTMDATYKSRGVRGITDLINEATIPGVRAQYHRNANYRIVGESVGSTETGLTIGAGTGNTKLGLTEGTYGSTEHGSPGVGLIGVKIDGRDVRVEWAGGSAPTAKAGRYEMYELVYFSDTGYKNPNEYVFVRHHNTGNTLEELLDDTTPQLGGDLDTNGNNILVKKAVTGTGEVFGSVTAKTATVDYNKIEFKTGPDAYNDNGEVTWSTRVQGALTQIFEIKGSSTGKSGISVNPNSNAEVDFLVAGSGDATLFVTDAGDDKVGVGKYPTQGKLDVDGDVYATTYYGDGSNLTGVSGGSSLTIQDEGTPLSTAATTLNFVGAGVTASGTGATKTITIAGGGSGIALTDLSVGSPASASGSGSIAYNDSTGVFTFTPPDLSSYLTAEADTLDTVTGRGATTSNNITVGDLTADDINGYVKATFNIGADGTNHYTFSDSANHWFPTTENDPTLYLRRGETYAFNNTSGAHPFQIQSEAGAGGAAYNTGVTNNNTVGVVTFKVSMSAPSTLYYQCSSHANMGGTMHIIDGANQSINVAGTATFEGGVIEGFSDLTGATGVVTHDCANGHIFKHASIAADFTANFTNLGLTNDHGTMVSLILAQGGTAYIPTAVQIGGSGQTILWQGGSPPSGTSSGTDIVSFSITQSSGSYTVLGQLTSYS